MRASGVVAGEPSKTRTVRVAWTAPRFEGAPDRDSLVNLTEGYSDESDIPKILGIFHDIDPDDIVIIDVT